MSKITKDQVLAAIEGSGGIIKTIARRLGCCRTTAKKYIDKWEATRTAMKEEQEECVDTAEQVILSSLKKNDVNTAKWYLALKAKNRGYGGEDTPVKEEKGLCINIILDDEQGEIS